MNILSLQIGHVLVLMTKMRWKWLVFAEQWLLLEWRRHWSTNGKDYYQSFKTYMDKSCEKKLQELITCSICGDQKVNLHEIGIIYLQTWREGRNTPSTTSSLNNTENIRNVYFMTDTKLLGWSVQIETIILFPWTMAPLVWISKLVLACMNCCILQFKHTKRGFLMTIKTNGPIWFFKKSRLYILSLK